MERCSRVDALPCFYQVPVFVRPFPPYLAKAWDLTLQLIVPCVDGINYVRRIADLTGVAVDLVTHALRQLLYFGYIAVIDIFQCVSAAAGQPGGGVDKG